MAVTEESAVASYARLQGGFVLFPPVALEDSYAYTAAAAAPTTPTAAASTTTTTTATTTVTSTTHTTNAATTETSTEPTTTPVWQEVDPSLLQEEQNWFLALRWWQLCLLTIGVAVVLGGLLGGVLCFIFRVTFRTWPEDGETSKERQDEELPFNVTAVVPAAAETDEHPPDTDEDMEAEEDEEAIAGPFAVVAGQSEQQQQQQQQAEVPTVPQCSSPMPSESKAATADAPATLAAASSSSSSASPFLASGARCQAFDAAYYRSHLLGRDRLLDESAAEEARVCSVQWRAQSLFIEPQREQARQKLAAAVQAEDLPALQAAIALARFRGVAPEKVWFAEVLRRRLLMLEALRGLLAPKLEGASGNAEAAAGLLHEGVLLRLKTSQLKDLLGLAEQDPAMALHKVKDLSSC